MRGSPPDWYRGNGYRDAHDTWLAACRLAYRVLSSPLRSLPDFVIIGAQKAGTTSLYSYLIKHPVILPSLRKEPHYFDEHYTSKGLLWYRAHFPTRRQRLRHIPGRIALSGEASAAYLFHPHAARRMAAVIPTVRLIALLRNPVDRAYSNYQMEVARGREQLSFEEAIEKDEERSSRAFAHMSADESYYSYEYRVYSYLGKGIYVDHLRRWLCAFSADQLLVIRSEDFFSDPGGILARILAHLGLEPIRLEHYEKAKESKGPPMAPAVRQRLMKYFAPHNLRLYEMLGRDLSWDE